MVYGIVGAPCQDSRIARRKIGDKMQRVVGAAVLMGMICLGGMLSDWMVSVHSPLDTGDAFAPIDSFPAATSVAAPARSAVKHAPVTPPPSFLADPLVFLSRAPADSLDLLPGIGPVLALRIVEARRAHGGRFASWDEVDAVKGIGAKLIARWRSSTTRQ